MIEYSKQLRIDPNINISLALSALNTYIKYKLEKDPNRPLGRQGAILYGFGREEGKRTVLVVIETAHSYIVRNG